MQVPLEYLKQKNKGRKPIQFCHFSKVFEHNMQNAVYLHCMGRGAEVYHRYIEVDKGNFSPLVFPGGNLIAGPVAKITFSFPQR